MALRRDFVTSDMLWSTVWDDLDRDGEELEQKIPATARS